jgi:hypothetical protein
MGVHERRAAVRRDELTRNPARVRRAQQRHDIGDVRRGSHTAHRGPAARMPSPRRLDNGIRQSVQHAVIGQPGTDAVDRYAARGECHSEVADERLECRLRGAHRHPGHT